jgi:hypothetical protein
MLRTENFLILLISHSTYYVKWNFCPSSGLLYLNQNGSVKTVFYTFLLLNRDIKSFLDEVIHAELLSSLLFINAFSVFTVNLLPSSSLLELSLHFLCSKSSYIADLNTRMEETRIDNKGNCNEGQASGLPNHRASLFSSHLVPSIMRTL